MIRSLFFKNWLPVVILSMVLIACSDARYSGLQRAKVQSVATNNPIREAAYLSIALPENQVIIQEKKLVPECISGFSNVPKIREVNNRKSSNKTLNKEKNSVAVKECVSPDDSVEVDIKEETAKAEKYGKLGLTFGIIGLSSMAAYIGFLFFIPGFILSALALYKVRTYDLKVKNKSKITSGFIINTIGLCSLILVGALIFFVLMVG